MVGGDAPPLERHHLQRQRRAEIERYERLDRQAGPVDRRHDRYSQLVSAVLVAVKPRRIAVFVKVDREREFAIAVGRNDRAGFRRLPAATKGAINVEPVDALTRPRIVAARVRTRPDAIGIAPVERAAFRQSQERRGPCRFVAMDARAQRDTRQRGIPDFDAQQGPRCVDACDLSHRNVVARAPKGFPARFELPVGGVLHPWGS